MANAPAFGKLFPQISAGYEYSKIKGNPVLADNPAQALAKIIQNGKIQAQPAAAAGTDVRIETPIGNMSALIFEGEVVSATMTAFTPNN